MRFLSPGLGFACGLLAACGSSGGSNGGPGADGGSSDSGARADGQSDSGSHPSDSGSRPDGQSDSGSGGHDSGRDGGDSGGCMGSVTVTVLDPSGHYAIPNAHVFIASGTLPTIPSGAGTCATVPTGASLTGGDGRATVMAPEGGMVDVVAQIGKWRVSSLVNVPSCSGVSTTLDLPATSSAGNVPSIAVTTGGADTLECTLHRLGLDGVVTYFQGAGGVEPTGAGQSSTLWASAGAMLPYDAVIFSCEGEALSGASSDVLNSYVMAGGLAYAEHWDYSVLDAAPFSSDNIATWNTGTSFLTGTTNAVIETSTPAGLDFQAWLKTYGAISATELPMLDSEAASNVATLGSASTLWIAADSSASVPNAPLLFTWNDTGRVVYADYHVADAVGDYGTTPGSVTVPSGAAYPSGCLAETTLKPTELAFLYTLFEQLSCGL